MQCLNGGDGVAVVQSVEALLHFTGMRDVVYVSIRYMFLPLDVSNFLETAHMKLIKLSDVVMIQGSPFATV